MAAWWGIKYAQAGLDGTIVCARDHLNSIDDSSFAEVRSAILNDPDLSARYDVGLKTIRTKCGRIKFAFAGLRHNLDSIKSKSKIRLLLIEEADPITELAYEKTIPTVREEGSEIWVIWNPERKDSPTDKRFRKDPPANSKIVELNYKDNPWFPSSLERKRLEDLEKRPDQYEHIWEGSYKTVVEGAYWTKNLILCKKEGRICDIEIDPLMTLRAFWDIGGTGAKADNTSVIIGQWINDRINIIDHYTAQGQDLQTHVNWINSNGYSKALCVLPHDGATKDKVHDTSYDSALRGYGFKTQIIKNQGTGAAMMRIEAAREGFHNVWFNRSKTESLRTALAWYHEKIDEKRQIGLGPDHDWSSHDADAFGMIFVAHKKRALPKPEFTFAM